jgi:hypothetical protein
MDRDGWEYATAYEWLVDQAMLGRAAVWLTDRHERVAQLASDEDGAAILLDEYGLDRRDSSSLVAG